MFPGMRRPDFDYITNFMGGRNADKAYKVIYTIGDFDPVSSQCVQNSKSDETYVFSAKMAHTEDLFYPHPAQDESVTHLQNNVIDVLNEWTQLS